MRDADLSTPSPHPPSSMGGGGGRLTPHIIPDLGLMRPPGASPTAPRGSAMPPEAVLAKPGDAEAEAVPKQPDPPRAPPSAIAHYARRSRGIARGPVE